MCAAWIEAAQPASRGVESGNAATAHGVFLTKHSGGAKSPLVVGRPVATNLGETNNMKRLLALFVLAASLLMTGCANTPSAGWVALIEDGKGLENFDRIGDANWRSEGGLVVADKGKGGHLVTKNRYKDFEIYAEFWAETTTNSGIFMRAQDPKNIGAANSYEVNIFDQRPGQEYSTGAIVDFAQVRQPYPKAGGKWNTYEVYVKGSEIVVKLNGNVTVATNNDKFKEGPFSLQYAMGANNTPGGAIKWRKVLVRPL